MSLTMPSWVFVEEFWLTNEGIEVKPWFYDQED